MALDDPAVRVSSRRGPEPDQILEVRLLCHERVAVHARNESLLQVLQDRTSSRSLARVDDAVPQRLHVKPLGRWRVIPHSKPGLLRFFGCGRVEEEHRLVLRVSYLVTYCLGRARTPPDWGVRIGIVPLAHVLDRRCVMALVEDVRTVLTGCEPRPLEPAHDFRVALELRVQKHHAQVALPVEKVDLPDVGHEGRPARETQAALLVAHRTGAGEF